MGILTEARKREHNDRKAAVMSDSRFLSHEAARQHMAAQHAETHSWLVFSNGTYATLEAAGASEGSEHAALSQMDLK